MRVKLVNPAIAGGLIDPQTGRSPFVDSETKTAILDDIDVPESNFWVRRILDGDLVRVADTAPPTGSEPVAPLTTRGGK